jgi:hypothetical protein
MTKRMIKEKTKITIKVDVATFKEDDYFVAYCPALELSGYGDTEQSAYKSFKTEVNIFIDETHKRGTLEKYLLKNRWSLQPRNYIPPRPNVDTLNLIKSNISVIRQDIRVPVND